VPYKNSFHPATERDLADAVRSNNPGRAVKDNLSDLAELAKFVASETQKWERLADALALFGAAAGASADDNPGPVGAEPSTAIQQRPRPPRSRSVPIPQHRRETLTRTMSQHPERLWRTAELAYVVSESEPDTNPQSASNLVSRALSVFEAEGLVERVKKGTVRWIGTSSQTEPEVSLLAR
jgi:hypothetical protein